MVTIYIAASWKHEHAVTMLTDILRKNNYDVASFVEDGRKRNFIAQPFWDWYRTKDADEAFGHDSGAALTSDVTIYIGPSGQDASAECGMAYAKGKILLALQAKDEGFGLMGKMFRTWFRDVNDLVRWLNENVRCEECRGTGEKEKTFLVGEEGMKLEMDAPTTCAFCDGTGKDLSEEAQYGKAAL